MNARQAPSRPVKAFVVDERGELIREITFDPSSLVTWGQVRAAGALGGYPVRIGYYQAQAVRGDALGVVPVWYGPVPKEVVDFARELLVDIKATFGEGVNARLHEMREYESRALSLGEDIRKRHQALEARSHALAEMFDSWVSGQAKMAQESAAIHASVAAIEGREGNLSDGWRRLEEARAALGREREEFKALADRLRGEWDRRTQNLEEQKEALKAVEAKSTEDLRALDAMHKERMAELTFKRNEIESTGPFLHRQTPEIHDATTNVARPETALNAVDQDPLAATPVVLADREKEVIRGENAQKERETALQSREAGLLRREVALRAHESKFDDTIRWLEQREAVLGSRTAKLEEDLHDMDVLREEVRAEKEFADQTKATADAQQAEVTRTMKFLQKKTVDILDREEQLRKREKKLEETESILDSQVEIVETQRNAIEVERTEARGKIEELQAELERVKANLAEAENAPPVVTASTAEAEKDFENRLKIIHQKAFALLDREERLREREEELNARERPIPTRNQPR